MNKLQAAYEAGYKTGIQSIKKSKNGLPEKYSALALACNSIWDQLTELSKNDSLGFGSPLVEGVADDEMHMDREVQTAYDRIQDLYSELKGADASMSELCDNKSRDPRIIAIPTSDELVNG